ncbi:MAG: 50S ribosomal protein L15 [Rhodothermales bacterium]|nr:50S ribosomal protein L15 [Rhodothermales bacterium]
MDLSNLKPAKGATKKEKRIARGVGSGYGGHSSTRGDKGQKSRAGSSIPVHFEGGQMPLQRRIPKFGFKNRFRVEYRGVNLERITKLVESGLCDASQPITPEVLATIGLVRKNERIKILGGGEPGGALQFQAHAYSASARAKIEGAGGTATVIK